MVIVFHINYGLIKQIKINNMYIEIIKNYSKVCFKKRQLTIFENTYGPANLRFTHGKIYKINGVKHNLFGPVVILFELQSNNKYHYLNGVYYTQNSWNNISKNLQRT